MAGKRPLISENTESNYSFIPQRTICCSISKSFSAPNPISGFELSVSRITSGSPDITSDQELESLDRPDRLVSTAKNAVSFSKDSLRFKEKNLEFNSTKNYRVKSIMES